MVHQPPKWYQHGFDPQPDMETSLPAWKQFQGLIPNSVATIVLFINHPFFLDSGGFLERRIPGKNGECTTRITTDAFFTPQARAGRGQSGRPRPWHRRPRCGTCLGRGWLLGRGGGKITQGVYRGLRGGGGNQPGGGGGV